eukprot:jgi/Botrbrau1/3695/Bobra.0008s0022.1
MDGWSRIMERLRHFGMLVLGRRKVKRGDCWTICGVVIVGCLLGYALASQLAPCMSPSGLPGRRFSGSCAWTSLKISFRARVVKSPAELEGDPCSSSLRAPKVALMFLTRGPMHHEGLWTRWLASAAGLVPADLLRFANCTDSYVAHLRNICRAPLDAGAVEAQHLFTIYVHPQPEFEGYSKNSIFHGRETAARIKTEWGEHSLVAATRELLLAALENPLNQKFVLLSESGIPLYPPTTIYQQLLTEPKSRINACRHQNMDVQRWHPRFEAPPGPVKLRQSLWRKSSQWFALSRSHAELVANDTDLDALFQTICHSLDWDATLNSQYTCYSDEHYIPSLLAYHGLESETDCWGGVMYADWQTGSAHPVEYEPQHVNSNLVKVARNIDHCHSNAAIRLSEAMFVPADQITHRKCTEDSPWSDRLILYDCPLFARKFPRSSVRAVQELLLNCDAQLDIVECEERHRRLQSLNPDALSADISLGGDNALLKVILGQS